MSTDLITTRVKCYFVGDGADRVTVTWDDDGWVITDARFICRLHVKGSDDDALAKAAELVRELRRISKLRDEVHAAEKALSEWGLAVSA